MKVKPDQLKAGDIIACNYASGRKGRLIEREVLRVIITKAGKTYLEGVILFSCKATWGQQNVGGTWRMATANFVRPSWTMIFTAKEVVESGLSWDDKGPNENVGINTIMEDTL